MTADEPTAIRHPWPGDLVHRFDGVWGGFRWTICHEDAAEMVERVPLSQTAPADRCRTCWPTTTEVTP